MQIASKKGLSLLSRLRLRFYGFTHCDHRWSKRKSKQIIFLPFLPKFYCFHRLPLQKGGCRDFSKWLSTSWHRGMEQLKLHVRGTTPRSCRFHVVFTCSFCPAINCFTGIVVIVSRPGALFQVRLPTQGPNSPRRVFRLWNSRHTPSSPFPPSPLPTPPLPPSPLLHCPLLPVPLLPSPSSPPPLSFPLIPSPLLPSFPPAPPLIPLHPLPRPHPSTTPPPLGIARCYTRPRNAEFIELQSWTKVLGTAWKYDTCSLIALFSTLWRVAFAQSDVPPPPWSMLLRKSALSAHWYNIERGRGDGEIEEGRFSAKKCRCPNTFVHDCLSWTAKTKMSITSQWFIVLPPNLDWWVFVTLCVYWVCNGLIGIVLARDVCDCDVGASVCKSMERPSQLAQNIRSESYQQFQARVLLAMENVPVEVIDGTIMSMPKRIQAILDSKGNRTKYYYCVTLNSAMRVMKCDSRSYR